MLLGLALLYVGAVLFLNGIWVMGHIEDREIAVINIFVGTLTLLIALYLAFGPEADAVTIKAAAFTLLFTFTYYWVAWNRWNGADGRGLGWFCFFVGATVIPITIQHFADTEMTIWGFWFGICWASWAVLWFLFWALLALKKPIAKATGAICAAQGVYTGWIPGYMLLTGLIA
ncbi:MAG: AmiS/UreI family transporter [Gammaproteobacteria bacterium]|nr:AmiS/UreI family transporter [Gammaproteobacteria bacterium]